MSNPIRDRCHLAFTSGRSRGCAAGLALTLALAPLPAVASQTTSAAEAPVAEPTEPAQDPQLDQAMQAYERGTQNYNLAQYEAALADFKEAASLYASPDFQYNIGLCYEKLGKYDEAIRAFATYLKAKPNAEDRPNVENRIAELQVKIEEAKEKVEEDEAARKAKEAEALEAAKNQSPPDDGEDDTGPVDDGRPLVLAGAGLIGLGAAVALGGGIGFGVIARQRSQSVDDVLDGNPDDLSFEETQTLDDEGRRFEAVQIGLAAGGAAIAVTGAVLLALGLRKKKAAQASAWIGPSMAGLSITKRF